MNMSMINFSSKTFWLGAGLVLAGIYKLIGIDLPVVPDVEIINALVPQSAAEAIQMGLAAIFVRNAISKIG